MLPAVNETSTKTAPQGAIDQIGHSLKRIIHAFSEADDDQKIFMAKWDVKDGFWRLQCQEGEEWNFAYVLSDVPGTLIWLVIPTSLQMGWIESPPYFCTASEMAQDVGEDYINTPVNLLVSHKFESYTITDQGGMIAPWGLAEKQFRFLLEVYVDDFMSLVIPTAETQLCHVANAVMYGIHNVFPDKDDEGEDPISLKKLKNGD